MSEGPGPFSMLAVSALENVVEGIEVWGEKYPAIRWYGGVSVTQLMIFCNGLLGHNDQQELILQRTSGPIRVEPGDWIVMRAVGAYDVIRESVPGSLFALVPDLPRSTPEERLSRIHAQHTKSVGVGGATDGLCVECGEPDPCPTNVWSGVEGKKRSILDTWDPSDDEEQESPPRKGEVRRAHQIMSRWDRSKEQEEWAQMILSRAERLGERE